VGVENRLGPLAERLRALTDELAASRTEAPAAATNPVVVDDLVAENQSANSSAAEESLDSLITALQDEGTAVAVAAEPPVAEEPTIDVQAVAAAIAEHREETVASRDTQDQTLREGLQSIATGLRADAAIESRQNVQETARNAEAASQVRSRREVQSNQREIQALQGDRRSAQQELRNADQSIRQLQSRNNRVQSESTQQANPGTSLDVLAQ
jgi:phage protein D